MKFHLPPFKTIITRYHIILIPLVLVIVTFAVYWQVHNFSFTSFDDTIYVSDNKVVQQGISRDNLIWAFSMGKTDDHAYWHPLTWLSHMLDCQLFGLNAGAHHLDNLLIHIINLTLLFLALYLMTGAPWRSGFVAALFALHPINVDSVAWIAERKNLLSTTFWMLTILTYIRYARKPDISRYIMVFCSLALGLLAKPMLVTLPCVLLLLDFWPLGRIDLGQTSIARHRDAGPMFQPDRIARLVMEKIPFLALSIATIALSVASLQVNNQLLDAAAAPMNLRMENAVVSYIAYLGKMVWPTQLAVFYPFPKFVPFWQSFGAAIFLISVSVQVFASARKSPWLITGWLWYMGTLLPVIGLVQGGLWPALADRWAYVPFIGIFIIIAWNVPERISTDHHLKNTAIAITAVAFLCILSVLTWLQAGHWKNSQTLFEHALTVTSGNYVAHNNLGNVFFRQGRVEEAIYHFTQANKIKPDYAEAQYNLANAFRDINKKDEAIKHYEQALTIRPNYENACNNLANLLLSQGRTDEAIPYYKRLLQLNPYYEQAQFNLANALKKSGRMGEAVQHYLQVLTINPHEAAAHYNLANAYKNQGQLNKAIRHYRQAIDIQPNNEKALQNLATVLMRQGLVDKAITQYLKALKINPDYVSARYNLGIAYYNTGNIPAAVDCFKAALRLDPDADHIRAALEQAMGKK
ncbi:MAG: tetratricopeptide repeat protein [Desulfobacteraceae bacterium]|jgi:tetratricopeptide (TPR) repeat protein|nr:tetratricopeptide repeat protein [Desulfobacteraceae bacterium]